MELMKGYEGGRRGSRGEEDKRVDLRVEKLRNNKKERDVERREAEREEKRQRGDEG